MKKIFGLIGFSSFLWGLPINQLAEFSPPPKITQLNATQLINSSNKTQNATQKKVLKSKFKDNLFNPLWYFPNPVKVYGRYTLSSLLSILGNAGINVVIEDNIGNPTLLLTLETSSIKEFLNVICTQANIWCKYDPIKREVKISKYKTFVAEFTPEGKISFSLGGSSGNSGGGSNNGNGGSLGGQSFSYSIQNISAEYFIEAIKQYFPKAKIYASPQGYIMFKADPQTYRDIVRYFTEKEKREERVYVDVELIRIDLKKQYQYGINWSGITDIGNINGLRHLGYGFSFNTITAGDMGNFTLLTAQGNPQALFTFLSQYGKIYKVDEYYAQTKTGTPLPFRNYKLVRYFTVSVETDANGNAIPNAELNEDEVGFRGVITVYKREKGPYKYYVDGVIDLSAVSDWVSVNIAGNQLTAPEIVGQTFKISTPLKSLYSTIIVGGFRSKGIDNNAEGMPGIMNIPGIGWLFKGKKDLSQNSEFLVVIHLRPAKEEATNTTWLERAGEEIFGNE